MEMSELDDAMQEYMAYLVFVQHRPFSYLDFLSFKVNGVEYNMSHGTFRNKISKLIATDKAELVCNSGLGFYSLKDIQVQKKLMTPNHTEVLQCHCHCHRNHPAKENVIHNAVTTYSTPPIYDIIENLPLDKNSLHDIHMRFEVPNIWTILSSSSLADNSQQQHLRLEINSVSKDIVLPSWKIKDLNIKVTVHRTNTVSVVVGCSHAPIALDINGVIRLSNALTRVEERLSRLVHDCSSKGINGDEYESSAISEHTQWVVTMWHFGADSSIEYTGEKFSASWEVGENALIRAYSKDSGRDDKTRIRLERQEYPGKSLADAVMDRLS